MIIVEGPDGSGKSTLIRKLGLTGVKYKSLRGGLGGVAYAGGDGERGCSFNLYGYSALACYLSKVFDSVGPMASKKLSNVAFDRFHISEHVYGPLLRNKQELSLTDLHILDRVLHDLHIPVILCLPPFVTTVQNTTKPGRHRPAYQTLGFLRHAYKGFEAVRPYATWVYDYTVDQLPARFSE